MRALGGYLAGFTLAAGAALADCSDDHVSVFGDWGKARFTVSVADDASERSQGLMNVPEMGTMSGMLFAYGAPVHATFWMRNTLIPLDMLFADSRGTITHIHENAIPLDETVIDGGRNVSYVLEVNGGMTARLGISVGDSLQHPLFGELAAIPCEKSDF